ncbi:hypothetical protein HZA33_04890 [Candidatus Pacearchaeota archaeon]|nr:hypothetical protein [Candidatus Pacearchaeota archaeon]
MKRGLILGILEILIIIYLFWGFDFLIVDDLEKILTVTIPILAMGVVLLIQAIINFRRK